MTVHWPSEPGLTDDKPSIPPPVDIENIKHKQATLSITF